MWLVFVVCVSTRDTWTLEVCQNYLKYDLSKKKVALAGMPSSKVCQFFFLVTFFSKVLIFPDSVLTLMGV